MATKRQRDETRHEEASDEAAETRDEARAATRLAAKRRVTAPKKPDPVLHRATEPQPVPVYVVNWPDQPPKRGPAKSV